MKTIKNSALKHIIPVAVISLAIFLPVVASAHWYCVKDTNNPQDYIERPAVTDTVSTSGDSITLNVVAKFCYSANMNDIAVSSWGFGTESKVCPNHQLNNSCAINMSDDRGMCGLHYWVTYPSVFPEPPSGDYASGAGGTSITKSSVDASTCPSGQMWTLTRNMTFSQADYAKISGDNKGFSMGFVSTERMCTVTCNFKTYPSAFIYLQAINNPVTPPSSLNVTCSANPSAIQTGQSSTFTASATGGSGNYSYVWSGACTGASQTCNNSFSSQGTQNALVIVTSGSQTATASCFVSVGQNSPTCTSNYQQRCFGNNLYWYDSCGNQQGLIQYCPNGCYNNSCQSNYINSCSYHSYQRCSGNNIYWYDSCGNQQDLIQYCPNGCYNNYCQTYNNYNNYNNVTLNTTKTVRDLTSGSGFSSSTYASPSDTLLFLITIQNNSSQDAQNVFIRDTLPANLIYNNQLVVACTNGNNNNYNNYNNYNNNYNNNCNNGNYNYGGSILSGINLNTIYAGQTVTISYQAQVAGIQNFSYGTTTLNNSVSVTSSNSGYMPAGNASVVVTRSAVLGASTVSTGLTNNFWVDSFFLPLMITLIVLWMWRTGMFFGIEKWLDGKKKIRRGYKSQKELSSRIETMKKSGRV